MSATASTPQAQPTLDVSSTPPIPFARQVGVELRKSFDTRAGLWFSIAIIALCLVVVLLATFAFPEELQTYVNMLGYAGGVLGYFLPILMIMLVTGEFGQRAGLITFTLEPRRSRVLAAKFAAGTLLSLVALAIGMVLAVGATAASPVNGGDAVWDLGFDEFRSFVLSAIIAVFVGFALATLLLNTAAAIVAYFVYTFILPIVVGALSALVDGFSDVAPWIDFNTAQTPLFTGDFQPSGEEWLQLLVTGLIWLVLPLVLGCARLFRAEMK